MFRITFFFAALVIGLHSYSQNDLDAMRYSRLGIGGTSRFIGLGGAFGAIGADLSCAAYNPAGLGLYRKGEISFSAGLKTTNNDGIINSKTSSTPNAAFTFNNFGILGGWPAKNDNESRNIISFTNSQLQNFESKTRMSSYTNSNSIVKDMLNIANEKKTVENLNSFYEDLAFQTLLLDTVYGKFISLLDTKRTVKQTRDIATTGRVNELNFSYAYAYKDEFYFGLSIGVPRVDYSSTTTHTEVDDKDSMRIGFTSPTSYTSTYVDGLPLLNSYYSNYLGFNSLTYTEYFKTTGSGVNLKLGGIARVNDNLRIGFYYHTPTIYSLKDEYYNNMSASFDKNPSVPVTKKDPVNGGYFNYKIITPGKVSINTAIIIKKISVIGIDYEVVNYKTASLGSIDVADFAGVNATIKNKYKLGHNLRVGTEFNIKPIMIRLGYNMQGSPFGNSFTGNFVRQSFCLGAGFRTKNNFYFDFVWMKTVTTEDYYLFTTLASKAILKYNTTSLNVTVGIKF
jgi:hypothetical protein